MLLVRNEPSEGEVGFQQRKNKETTATSQSPSVYRVTINLLNRISLLLSFQLLGELARSSRNLSSFTLTLKQYGDLLNGMHYSNICRRDILGSVVSLSVAVFAVAILKFIHVLHA